MLITVQPKVGCGCPLLPGAKEDAGQQGGGWPPVQRPTPPLTAGWSFPRLREGPRAETAQSDRRLETGRPAV